MLELLSDQAVFDLTAEELMELEQLENQFPDWKNHTSFELTVAMIGLTDIKMFEMPEKLRTKILENADDYFNTKKTLKDMASSFRYVDTTEAGIEEINNYFDDYKSGRKVLDPQYINQKDLTAQDISGYKIKGYWYFDKRQSEMKYRMLAICPVAPEARDIGSDNPDVIELFWIYFPSIRDVLHDAKAFNDKNSAMPITFDHLLNSRRFNGTIYKEENVYGDRQIADYEKDNAQMQLLESERVKEKIRNFEQDMWNY